MFLYYLPVLIVVAANVLYDISSKSIPEDLNPYMSITITYSLLTVLNFTLFQILNPGQSLQGELTFVNFAVLFFALASVGLESGYIFLFRAGWNISLGGMVCNISLAVCMVLIGTLAFHEKVSLHQVGGMLLCALGLIIINRTEFQSKVLQEDEALEK